MGKPDVFGATVKISRAKELRDALELQVVRTIGFASPQNPVRTRHGFNDDMTEYRLWIEDMPKVLMLAFGVIIGDVIHNLRSALDHVAWELVDAVGDISLSSRWDVQFPIYDSPELFKSNVRRRLPGVPDPYITAIDGLQPYMRKNLPEFRGFGSPLAKLATLSNRDKHQIITPIMGMGTHIPWFKPNGDLVICDRIVDEGPLKEGANIVRHFVKIVGPNPQMKVEGTASFDIALEEAPAGETVPLSLVRIENEVRRVITLVRRIANPMFP